MLRLPNVMGTIIALVRTVILLARLQCRMNVVAHMVSLATVYWRLLVAGSGGYGMPFGIG